MTYSKLYCIIIFIGKEWKILSKILFIYIAVELLSIVIKTLVFHLNEINFSLCMNNGEFVVSVYKAAFREHPAPKSTSRVCTLL